MSSPRLARVLAALVAGPACLAAATAAQAAPPAPTFAPFTG
jgi:hypothetical protein